MPAPCCDHEADSAPAPLKLTVWRGLRKPDLGQAAGNTAGGMDGETQAAECRGAQPGGPKRCPCHTRERWHLQDEQQPSKEG